MGLVDVIAARLFMSVPPSRGDTHAVMRLGATLIRISSRAHLPIRGDQAKAVFWYSYGGTTPK